MNLGRKITGGKYHRFNKKRLYQKISQERPAVLGETKTKTIRVKGGILKTFVLKTNSVNLLSEGKVQKATIINVEKTPQNTFLARQNRLMKGAIIETSAGKARITNRPSQEGHVNAIVIKE